MFESYQPYWIYNRFNFGQGNGIPEEYFYKLDFGFNYLARRIFLKACYQGGLSSILPMPEVQVFDTANNKERYTRPVKGELLSSPGNDDTYLGLDVPIVFNTNAISRPPASTKILNYLYASGHNINVKLSVSTVMAGNLHFVDMLIQGYLIPEKAIPMWKGKN